MGISVGQVGKFVSVYREHLYDANAGEKCGSFLC